jgi:hypothetical protein
MLSSPTLSIVTYFRQSPIRRKALDQKKAIGGLHELVMISIYRGCSSHSSQSLIITRTGVYLAFVRNNPQD